MVETISSTKPQGPSPDVVAWLDSGQAFGGNDRPRRIDTHAASIFLAADRAWKLKRPVRYPYLDFSTPEKRGIALAQELSLNSRIAPALYLGLHRITLSGGTLALDGEGEVVDHILEMRRFPDDALLSRQVAEADLPTQVWLDLADTIMRFHQDSAILTTNTGCARLREVIEGNAASMACFPNVLQANEAHALISSQLALLMDQAPLLDRRAALGRIRHGHGDLHLSNIAMIDGKLLPFDCLEFDDNLATTDVLYDLAFLLMDLWQQGFHAQANLVFNRYIDRSPDDEDATGLLALFMSLRATIRAHVLAAQAKDRPEATAQALSYLVLARALIQPKEPRLMAVAGLSGTGKSTLARALAGGVGAPPGARILRSDVLRKRIAGVEPERRLPNTYYTQYASFAVYELLGMLARQALACGQSVLVDAVLGKAAERMAIRQVAIDADVPFIGLWLQLDEAARIARIEGRGLDASDADAKVARLQTQHIAAGPDEDEADWLRQDARIPLATMKDQLSRLICEVGH